MDHMQGQPSQWAAEVPQDPGISPQVASASDHPLLQFGAGITVWVQQQHRPLVSCIQPLTPLASLTQQQSTIVSHVQQQRTTVSYVQQQCATTSLMQEQSTVMPFLPQQCTVTPFLGQQGTIPSFQLQQRSMATFVQQQVQQQHMQHQHAQQQQVQEQHVQLQQVQQLVEMMQRVERAPQQQKEIKIHWHPQPTPGLLQAQPSLPQSRPSPTQDADNVKKHQQQQQQKQQQQQVQQQKIAVKSLPSTWPGQANMPQQIIIAAQPNFEVAGSLHAPVVIPLKLAPASTNALHYLKQPDIVPSSLGPMDTTGEAGGHLENENWHPCAKRTVQSTSAAYLPDIFLQQQAEVAGVKEGDGQCGEMRLFKCLTCGKGYKSKSVLHVHERIHTDSRPYGCLECGKSFRCKPNLTRHMRVHTMEKPFACEYCKRSFRARTTLNQHLRIHRDEKPYECPECGKNFRQQSTLNKHVQTHRVEHTTAFSLPGGSDVARRT